MVRKNSTQKSEIVHDVANKITFNDMDYNNSWYCGTYAIKILSK